MDQLFAAFGLDWRLLAINLVNFGLLLGVLWYFLYTPVLRVLEERRQKIAQGVADANRASEQLAAADLERTRILSQAGTQADEMLSRTRAEAERTRQEALSRAEAAAAAVLEEAQARARESQERARQESREEIARLAVLGAEKILKNKA